VPNQAKSQLFGEEEIIGIVVVWKENPKKTFRKGDLS
jgi:hypothetical protein